MIYVINYHDGGPYWFQTDRPTIKNRYFSVVMCFALPIFYMISVWLCINHLFCILGYNAQKQM